LLEPRHGLAHLADRATLERERARVDERLVPEVERPEAGFPPEPEHALARAENAELEPVQLCEAADLADEIGERLVRPDRVAGDEQHAALDPVADERALVRREQVVRVAA